VRDRAAVTARWSAHDDNGDELIFDVYVRGDGEKNWRLLRARVSERESDRFIIDTTPPLLTALQGSLQGGMVHASFVATDAISPIAHAEYSLDAGRWQYLDPVGKLSDSLTEHYDFTVPLAAIAGRTPTEDEPASAQAPVTDPQEHILTVRVYDRYENVSAAKAVIH
jgi:hypothetical protein